MTNNRAKSFVCMNSSLMKRREFEKHKTAKRSRRIDFPRCVYEPGPLSFVLVTVMVFAGRFPLAVVRCASANGMAHTESNNSRQNALRITCVFMMGLICFFITFHPITT